MIGGELINKGSYGCIYKPGLKCNSEQKEMKENIITKVQMINKFSIKEMEISKKIVESYKDYSEHFSPILESCEEVEIKEIEDELKKCTVIEKNQKFILNKMKYEGDKILGVTLFENVSKEVALRQYFYSLIMVLESIEKLNDIDIIHLDLKSNNIIYNNNKERPIIIDFGLSCELEKLKNNKDYEKDIFFTYAYDYEPWCIDLSIITYIVEKNKKNEKITKEEYETNIVKIISDYSRNNTSVFLEMKGDYDVKLKKYFEKYIGKSYSDLSEDLKKNAKSWDGYSVLIMYNYLLLDLFNKESNNELKEIGKLKEFIEGIEKNLYINPDERKTAKELKELFKGIIKKIGKKELSKKMKEGNKLEFYKRIKGTEEIKTTMMKN
tara:strand:+ start:458 stop:1600 length:1143 start_codon:yes stop_codon:yes gene_type:complete